MAIKFPTGATLMRADELRVDDNIHGYLVWPARERPSLRQVSEQGDPYRGGVSKIDEHLYTRRRPDDPVSRFCRIDERVYCVVTRGFGRYIPDWPHLCPYCGERAYVGLNEIVHQPGGSANCR